MKQILRKFIKKKDRKYIAWLRNHHNALTASCLYLRYLLKGGEHISLRPPGSSCEIEMKPTGPNLHLYSQIFYECEYRVGLENPGLVIDAGAHIGLGAIFFANRYPGADVLSIEADASNFSTLCKNTKDYDSIKPLHRALWSEATTLNLKKGSTSTRSIVSERRKNCHSEVKTITISKILNNSPCEEIGILKLDVEGAEVEILSSADDWANRARVIIVEPHDKLRSDSTSTINEFSEKFGFDIHSQGENLLLTRTKSSSME